MRPLIFSLIIALGLLGSVAWADELTEAVAAYRAGHYSRAAEVLAQHHKTRQPTAKSQYYQAITQAQLGQLDDAARTYQHIMTHYPGTPEAQLAETGLTNLQALAQPDLDSPPGGQPANKGLTPEQLQMQSLMGMLGNSNNSQSSQPDMSLWANLMQTKDPNQSPLDATNMSTMLMNQWMGQMDMGLNDRHDR